MSFHSLISIQKYAFKSTWEIDEKLINGSGTIIRTKPEIVEGMADLEWHLICDTRFAVDFSLYIKSKERIEYSLEYKFLHSSKLQGTLKFDSNLNSRHRIICTSRNDLPKYSKNGKITLEIEACFSYKDAKFNYFNVCDATEWGLRLKESTSTDFDILVDDKTIGIHKHMVTAESPVFEKMFESNFKESKEKKVTIPDFKKEVVQAAMDYCYRQDITVFLKDHENTMDLLRFCDKYDFQTLKPKLEKQIVNGLSKENVFYIASKSEEANAAHLRQACIDFIRPLLNNTVSWPNLDMSQIDATLFKDIVSGALNMNISE